MDCHHFDAGTCRSCAWLPRPYDDQLAAKQRRCVALIGDDVEWLPPFRSAESGFRNKAKMVVSGTAQEPRLGILDDAGVGVDIRDCGLHVPAVRDALPVLAAFVTRAALTPYDLGTRRGELKYVLVTASPDAELMVRFVSRSQEPVARLRKHLSWLEEALPNLVAVSLNLQPEHKAVLEGDREIPLGGTGRLTMRMNGHRLHLRPQSFFQTNTEVAAGLYRESQQWVDEVAPRSVWDLYCGVGGFALHVAARGRAVVGVESSPEAVAAARESAHEAGLQDVSFLAGDAAQFALGTVGSSPDLVVVNPPRRGVGPELARWVESSTVEHVLYSSCNPDSLARDLASMPSMSPVRARLFDMFPQTSHAEVLLLLERRHERGLPLGRD
ncbi:MAG TPA: 23S rRNA (uracil(747)-C(5))-methyltransferase RlmC [Nocardioidaceae bacterium]|nr:23S rRNA (uracil(747)-C(5))-methyltransferase RlmC [Nocardioidaceae bacterium]